MFYELKKPIYESDSVDRKENPIKLLPQPRMPGLICKNCGVWAGSRRVYQEISNKSILIQLSKRPLKPLPENEWNELAVKVLQTLNPRSDLRLRPGDKIGHLSIELLSPNLNHIMHPFPGLMIVSQDVVDILNANSCTGIDFIPVTVGKPKSIPATTLYELAITGNAWRVNITEEDVILSQCCGRYQFPNTVINIDKTRWDKSDFFILDMNPNRIFVTNKVATILEEARFENYEITPL